jgi:pilus assembly protein Flp/PilA
MNSLVLRATCFAQSLAAVSKDRSGVTAIEYGLIATLIALFIIGTVGNVGVALNATFVAIEEALTP